MKRFTELTEELRKLQEIAELEEVLEFYNYDENLDIWYIMPDEERVRPLNF